MIVPGIATVALAVAGLLWAYELATGWYADPALWLGLAAPLFTLTLFLFVIVVFPVCLVSQLRAPRSFTGLVSICISAVALFVVWPHPYLPNAVDAFQWRMQNVTEEQFFALAGDIRDMTGEQSLTVGDESYGQTLHTLQAKHDILKLDTFMPRLSVDESHVTVDWSSGLTGGFAVTIVDRGERPTWVPAPNIYESVSAYSRCSVC